MIYWLLIYWLFVTAIRLAVIDILIISYWSIDYWILITSDWSIDYIQYWLHVTTHKKLMIVLMIVGCLVNDCGGSWWMRTELNRLPGFLVAAWRTNCTIIYLLNTNYWILIGNHQYSKLHQKIWISLICIKFNYVSLIVFALSLTKNLWTDSLTHWLTHSSHLII